MENRLLDLSETQLKNAENFLKRMQEYLETPELFDHAEIPHFRAVVEKVS